MTTHNASNERIKRRYFAYLKEAKRHSKPTVDAVAKALNRFEVYTNYRDFKAFHIEQAIAFKKHLADQPSQKSEGKISKATLRSTFGNLKHFFQWLAQQPGYKSRIQHASADFFNLSDKEMRIATARREQKAPTLEQIRYTLTKMPASTEIERRNRALIAFTLLTGARDSAVASLRLKHIDLAKDSVFQDAREVRTKNSKTFKTYFFSVGEEVRPIFEEWLNFLLKEKLWGSDDPVFPATQVALDVNRQFAAVGLSRRFWTNTSQIRAIFRNAFLDAGVPYFNPHSFRKTLAQLGEKVCRTPEEFKAWSQNLGHEGVLTTFFSYGEVGESRQAEIIRGATKRQLDERADIPQLLREALRQYEESR